MSCGFGSIWRMWTSSSAQKLASGFVITEPLPPLTNVVRLTAEVEVSEPGLWGVPAKQPGGTRLCRAATDQRAEKWLGGHCRRARPQSLGRSPRSLCPLSRELAAQFLSPFHRLRQTASRPRHSASPTRPSSISSLSVRRAHRRRPSQVLARLRCGRGPFTPRGPDSPMRAVSAPAAASGSTSVPRSVAAPTR
jgi:hypothetical protein